MKYLSILSSRTTPLFQIKKFKFGLYDHIPLDYDLHVSTPCTPPFSLLDILGHYNTSELYYTYGLPVVSWIILADFVNIFSG